MAGAGVGEFVFDFGDVRGDFPQICGIDACLGPDCLQAPPDCDPGAAEFPGDLCRAHCLDAVKAENGESVGIEFAHQCEDPTGEVFVHFFGLCGEFGEEFAWRCSGVESAMARENHVNIQGKESCFDAGEERLGPGVELIGSGGEKNKFTVEGGDDFGDDATEDVAVGLDG